ncbi:MAG: topoisomerase [Bacteroidota bacterium]|nr:topoisomerase [Bacteroidota bacterium]
MVLEGEISVNKRTLRAGIKDPAKSAKAVNLVYVSDQDEGFVRLRDGASFYYMEGDQKLTDKDQLARIKKLVIPPAWENVWICKLENGHLQVTGTDKLGRKQYRYHPSWNTVRNHTKFYRLLEFGKQLPVMRKQLEKHLSLSGFPREKVLAAVVSLLERTKIRIGNSFYEKLYGSFGLSTMKNRHVQVNGTKIVFTFKGKKGVQHQIDLRSRRLANIVKGCKEIPGKELFTYLDENGAVHNVESGMVNEYIRTISSGDFTAKDFRTWAGTVQAILGFKEVENFESETEKNRKIVAVYDMVAKQLGNTRTVCKKYYVHPIVVKLYEEKKLGKYLEQLNESEAGIAGLSPEEELLLKILETN